MGTEEQYTVVADARKNFDFLEIPLEGVAAYWLALRTLLGSNRTMKPLLEEAEHVLEPFTKTLLSLLCAEMPTEHIIRLMNAKQRFVLADLKRRLDLMALTLIDMTNKENPHRTLAKMLALFTDAPADPSKIIKYSQSLFHKKFDTINGPRWYTISSQMHYDILMGTLLFYVFFARKNDRMAAQPYLQYIQSRYFSDGLALIIDGFDPPFLRSWLETHRDTLLEGAHRKMELSLEMALALKHRMDFDDVKQIAAVFLP